MNRIAVIGLAMGLLTGCIQPQPCDTISQRPASQDSLIQISQAELERFARYLEAWGRYKEYLLLNYQMGKMPIGQLGPGSQPILQEGDPDYHYLKGFLALAREEAALARTELRRAPASLPPVERQLDHLHFVQNRHQNTMVAAFTPVSNPSDPMEKSPKVQVRLRQKQTPNKEADAFNALQIAIIDCLYFVEPYVNIQRAVRRPGHQVSGELKHLIDGGYIHVLTLDRASGDYVKTSHFDANNLRHYYFLASKDGLLKQNGF